MYPYQKTGRYFAQIPGGFDALAAGELEFLGARRLKAGFRGIHFSAEPAVLYRINYHARLVIRVLAPLVSFRCRNRDDIYRAGKTVDWPTLFSDWNTFSIAANVSGNPNLRHSQFAALCLKDAIVDHFRSRSGRRPNVDTVDPDLRLYLHIERQQGVIGLDTSGGSLHRRGYRLNTVEAPLQETLAAAMVALSQWRGKVPVVDPMCGSGTLLCEALMAHCRIPAGFLRKNEGFRFLPDFDNHLWERIKTEGDAAIRPLPDGLIAGSDVSRAAIKAAEGNCRRLPGGDRIRLSVTDFSRISDLSNRMILCNPPYGIRMKAPGEPGAIYRQLGDFLKRRCTGSRAVIYFGNREMIKRIGLKPSWKKPLSNAALDGRAVLYELY